MRASFRDYTEQEDWLNAARNASNLSELELTLGEVAGALGHAEQFVTYAEHAGDAFIRETSAARLGDALHQAGRLAEAETLFREAEQMQAESQPYHPLLYSVSGFQYCDLLLAAPERASLQMVLHRTGFQAVKTSMAHGQDARATCRGVFQRAAQTLKWVTDGDLGILTIALNHLTLGRAALYSFTLDPTSMGDRQLAIENVAAAVAGLRRAGTIYELPRGLLIRAWLRFLTGARTGPESAQEDLDEAWEIAERGPMRLFMADIHLYRARLFGPVSGKMVDDANRIEYPWNKNPDGSPRGAKDDLAAARKLIEQCGYWRRKEELEDAEAAAKNWE
ncbi:MAG TPA: hypothetical protein VE863_18065 [Pyrinomonadaceae bacterium]|jgi:tetratricopeptide (TPR) repeat protein|nr:hypothetical protein [Pyrinomonadaceae bacterium]